MHADVASWSTADFDCSFVAEAAIFLHWSCIQRTPQWNSSYT